MAIIITRSPMKSIVRKVLSALTLILITVLSFVVLVPVLEAHADTALTEIRVSASMSKVMEGDLPVYSAHSDSDHVVGIEQYGSNTNWSYWRDGYSSWHGFGLETPVAEPDGDTHYALSLRVELEEGYEFADNTAIYLNDVNMTEFGHTMAVNMGEHAGYVYIDLGTAYSWPPAAYSVTTHTIFDGVGGTYTVEYETESESVNEEKNGSGMYTVPAETTIRLTASPIPGYYFAGWYTTREIDIDGNGHMAFLRNELQTSDLVLDYNPWADDYLTPLFVYGEAETVNVTVNVNGGEPISPDTFEGFKGESIMEILMRSGVDPTHSEPNKALVGVCTTATCEVEVDGGYIVYEDMTVYLKWMTVTPHELTYNLNYYGDERDVIHTETVYEEMPVEFIEDPQIEGRTFNGWAREPECQNYFEPWESVTEDTTIYACWLENIDSIELTVAAPRVGDTVTLTYNEEWDIDEPNIVPEVTSASENYASHHPDWVNGLCNGGSNACNELFSGTFEADTDYYARVDIHAENGYALTIGTLDHITVNGEAPAEIFTVYGRTDTQIIVRIRSVESEHSGPYAVHFVRYTGSGTMEDIPKNDNEELTFPECGFTAPEGMIFNAWYIDDGDDRYYYWPGDRLVVHSDLTVVVDWTQENFVGTFRAGVVAPYGGTISSSTVTPDDGKYTAEINAWYRSSNPDELGDALDASDTFTEGTYIVSILFTTVGDYRVAYPHRAIVNDRSGTVFLNASNELLVLATVDVAAGGEESGEPDVEFHYGLVKQNTSNLEVLYETDIATFVNNKKQDFLSHMGNTHGLNIDALFKSDSEPYKIAEYVGQSITLVCLNAGNEEIGCTEPGRREVYYIDYLYNEVLVTRKTTVTVEFNTNGGGGMDEIDVPAGQPMDVPEDPERAGYSFAGWSKDTAVIDETTGASSGSLFDFSTPLTGETTLVANWKKIYEVSFNDGAILPEDRKPVTQLVVAGNALAPAVDSSDRQLLTEYGDYTFVGFFEDASFEVAYAGRPIENDMTIYIKWQNEAEEEAGGEVVYTILEGANQTHSVIDDADKDIVVKASGEIEKFVRAEVDGAALGEGDGTITAGSTVVTLKADYLNKLSLGAHTLKFVYDDGEVETKFTIVNPTVEESPFTADKTGIFKTMFVISLVGLSLGWLRLKSLARNERTR